MRNGNGSTTGQKSCHKSCCNSNGGVILPGDEVVVDEGGMPYHRACAPERVRVYHDNTVAIGRRVAELNAARQRPTSVSPPGTARPGGMSVAEQQATHDRQRSRADAGRRDWA
ncbi:hypothetical protein HY477_01020 [Candidatus Uhrbacteria bacterium]|nr:hypothetical protein [Candidatus Uhrbacteria bacterium]